jgi:PBP1b-binding outer membrane lipoprotein LpoB
MKKLFAILGLVVLLAACSSTCETEPIVEQNHKLIVPPNFGQQPK